MSVYTCDVCGKSTIIDTKSSILFTGCLLTAHCNGKMRLDRTPSPSPTTQSVKRYALDIINQPLLSKQWRGTFNVSVQPTVLIYKLVSSGNYTQVTSGYTVHVNDDDDLIIDFDVPTAGVAHIITHTSYRTVERASVVPVNAQLTVNGILTFAVPRDRTPTMGDITFTYTNPSTNQVTNVSVLPIAHKSVGGITLFNTPWKTVDAVNINGQQYKLFSVNMNTLITMYDGSFTITTPYEILLSRQPHAELVDIDNYGTLPIGATTGSMTRTELFIDSIHKTQYNIPIKPSLLIF